MLEEFITNFMNNLFKPLLLFFYLGFLIPLLKVPLEFPPALYKGITIYLLVAIGWHGGEELAELTADDFQLALGFMAVGFVTNTIIALVAYQALRRMTRLRKIDAATVAGLLWFGFGRHVCHVCRCTCRRQYRVCGLYAGDACCHGNSGLSCRTLSGFESTSFGTNG